MLNRLSRVRSAVGRISFDFGVASERPRNSPPTILTALPKKGAKEVERQKREWVSKHLGPDVGVITCMTSDKPKYAEMGAVLIDDRNVNAAAWEKAGGIFILHEGFHTTLSHLQQRGII